MSNATQIVPVANWQSLVTYNVSDEIIESKRAEYSTIQFNDAKGYETGRKAIADLRTLRSAIESRRQELKAVPLDMGKYIDSEAKRITALVESIEQPLKLKKSAVDDEKERVRKEREAAERKKLEDEARSRVAAEEARLKAIRDEEEKRLAAEKAKLEAERKQLEIERLAREEAERKERERLAAIQKVEDDKRAAEQARIAAEQKAESDRLAAEQRRIDEENRKIKEAKEAAERVEFERQAKIKAEQEAKEKIEREARELEERRQAEVARKAAEEMRLAALRPDVEKLAAFAVKIRELALTAPNVGSEESQKIIIEAVKRLDYTATQIELFCGKKSKQ